MCGIAGYIGHPRIDDLSVLNARMREAIRYRGRDGEGEWLQGRDVALFHSRLSIIDLDGGSQPMTDVEGRYLIVFNGEIYNYLELRKSYEAGGARFKTESDTEVILEGYKRKGAGVCGDLNGMFAFAIWDTRDKTLFLARDRLGKKPLFWTTLGRAFYFASSLDAFRHIPGWTGDLSRIDLDAYAAIGDFRTGRTAFRQGRTLPPASHAFVDLDGDREPRIETYWRMDFSRRFNGSFADALDSFENLIADAISIRLRADVPVALTFSGGVDSGIIAAISKKRLSVPLSCWSIDYDTADDPSEETSIAREVAGLLELDWHYEHFDYHNDLIPSLREILRRVDQPCRHIAISYSDRLYGAIRPYAKVVLSGNGADELFLGYAGNEDLLEPLPAVGAPFWRRLVDGLADKSRRATRVLADYQTDYVRANLDSYRGEQSPEAAAAEIRQSIIESNVANRADLYTFMALKHFTSDPNYRLPDIAGLNQQVEVRSPFLDYRVVEFAASLPPEYKIGDRADANKNKRLLKHYYARHVPERIAWATKKGMGSNLRYDRTLASDPKLVSLFETLLARIDRAGLPSARFNDAWKSYRRDKQSGVEFPASSGALTTGLMLGLWLESAHAQ